MTLRAIEPEHFPWFDYKRYTFSLGLEQNGYAWLSGHTATEYDPEIRKNVVRGDMAEQTRTSLTKVGALLAAAGLSFADTRRLVRYVTLAGIDHLAEADAVTAEFLGDANAAICTVVVNRLLRPQAWIENEVTAGPADDGIVYLDTIHGTDPAEMIGRAQGAGRIVKTTWYATRDAAPPKQWEDAAMTVVGVQRVADPDATLSLDVIASRGEHGYQFLSGRTGVGADVAAQAESALGEVLSRAAGGRLIKTVEYVTPVGLERYRDVAGVRDRLLEAPYPASTGCVCDWLPNGAQFLVDAMATVD